MLGYLGFAVSVQADPGSGTLNVLAAGDAKLLIGPQGERLEGIQHLVNRIAQSRRPDAPRIRVDIDGYLATRDYRLVEETEAVAARVLASGEPAKLEPMNSYQRRLVHHHFKDHPRLRTWSPEDSARLKRITILPKDPS